MLKTKVTVKGVPKDFVLSKKLKTPTPEMEALAKSQKEKPPEEPKLMGRRVIDSKGHSRGVEKHKKRDMTKLMGVHKNCTNVKRAVVYGYVCEINGRFVAAECIRLNCTRTNYLDDVLKFIRTSGKYKYAGAIKRQRTVDCDAE